MRKCAICMQCQHGPGEGTGSFGNGLLATLWLLGIEPEFSVRAPSALNHESFLQAQAHGGVLISSLLPAHRLHLVITLSTSMVSSNGFESLNQASTGVTQPRVFVQQPSCSPPPRQLTGDNRLTGGSAELGMHVKALSWGMVPKQALSASLTFWRDFQMLRCLLTQQANKFQKNKAGM